VSTESYIFGQSPNCDVVITDPYVSGRHARAWRDQDGNVWVEDLGTTNGTWVVRDGVLRRAEPRLPIRPGDTLVIGRTRIPWTERTAT